MAPPITPPQLSAGDFAKALDDFREALGAEWVIADEDGRSSYLDPFAVGDPWEHGPSAALAPANVEELRAVLQLANRHAVPLWPVSMGKNFAYGTSAPRQRGAVVLDLKRMNRVLEVNEELGYAVVEPGVSFFDFKEELDRRGGHLWMSGPAHSWGSVIGNALEHGVGYTPYGVHADMICGMEVMLADGTLVRTGFGAAEGTQEWQCYNWSFGPNLDGLFTQSNFGIVTKMGIWLMPQPEGVAGVSITVPGRGDLAALVDTLRPLKLNDTINATYTIANGWRIISRGKRHADFWDDPYTSIPPDVVQDTLDQTDGAGWWSVIFNLFDRPDVLDIRLKVIEEAFAARLPDATMRVRRWERGQPIERWMRQDVGLSALGTVEWQGSPGGHTDFGPVMAAVGERVDQVYSTVERRFLEYGADPWVGMFGMGRRALVMVADLYFVRTDTRMTDNRRALFRQLCDDMKDIGVGLYRSHLSFMDDAAALHTWNEAALNRFNSRLKKSLDPNGIIAPGKQGIWT